MAKVQQAPNTIPAFASLEDEAAFWNTHSTEEFADAWEPAVLEFVRPLQHGIEVWFDAATIQRLFEIARARGDQPSELAARWITEALDREIGAPPVASQDR